jgi:hypothetical protein
LFISFLIGRQHPKKETNPIDGYITIQQYDVAINELKYYKARERAFVYILYQIHHGKEIDSTFAKYVDEHIFIPRDNQFDEYIKWETASPNETPLQLARTLDSLSAIYCESIAFMWVDEEYDSSQVYESETYEIIMDAVNSHKTRIPK